MPGCKPAARVIRTIKAPDKSPTGERTRVAAPSINAHIKARLGLCIIALAKNNMINLLT
jgi:hypothetical protein